MGPRNVPWECHRAYPIKESKVLLVERSNSMLADLNAARVTDLIVPHILGRFSPGVSCFGAKRVPGSCEVVYALEPQPECLCAWVGI